MVQAQCVLPHEFMVEKHVIWEEARRSVVAHACIRNRAIFLTVGQGRWLFVVVRLHESKSELGKIFVRDAESSLQPELGILKAFALE